jgi:phospholipase/carboxylesterase
MFDALLSQSWNCKLHYEFWPALESSSRKILIILHGRGDTLEGFHFFPSRLGIDSLNVLFLEAPDPYGTGFSWYELPPRQGPGILRSRRYLFEILDGLQKDFGLKASDIFLCGFSQGCLLTLDLALRYPKVLGGIVGMSGYLFFEEEYPAAFSPVAREQRLWVSHGFHDEILSFERTEASMKRLQELGISLCWNPLPKDHTVDEVEEIPLIRSFILTQLEAN